MSRNTVREALRSLISTRLVRHDPHRGFTVTELSPEDVSDIYRLRRLVEITALREAMARTGPWHEPLAAALAAMEGAAEDRHWSELFAADVRFHAALVRHLGQR